MITDYDSAMADIRAKKIRPLYFFCGEEDFFIDQLTYAVEENFLSESEKAFNLTILYGKDCNAQTILEICRRVPLMAERQVVLVKEANQMHHSVWDNLLEYVKKPVPTTVLVFAYKNGKPDKRKAFGKEIGAKAVYIESNKLYDDKVPAWASKLAQAKGLKLDERAAELLAESIGTDLSTLNNELEKLRISTTSGVTVTVADIERHVGVSREYSSFELNNALATRNLTKAHKIVNYFAANPKNSPLVLVLGTMQSFFQKVYVLASHKSLNDRDAAALLGVSPYFMKDYRAAVSHYHISKLEQIFLLLEEYDLRAKGINNIGLSDGQLLKELTARILG